MHPRSWNLAETNYAHTRNARVEVAVLPFGATEPHNLHLPYGTDSFQSQIVGETICEEASRRGARVMLLPTIPYGTETNLSGFPWAMNVNPSTLALFVSDLVVSLAASGVRKLLLLNGHGGNDFKPLLRELHGATSTRLFLCDWFRVAADQHSRIFDEPGDHAGELETSFMLAFRPDLVVHTPEGGLAADDGAMTPSRFEAIERRWVSISRDWRLLTTNSGAGNPHAATAEKGKRLMEIVVERLAQFLVELSESPVDDTFPFRAPS